MSRKVSHLIILLCCITVMISCDSNHIFDEYKAMPNQWHKDSIAAFNLTAPDTTNNYNLFVNIRNTNDYKYNNLYLIVELNAPEGKVTIDTLEYKMAAPNGELLGSGFSDIKENKLWYKGFKNPFRFTEIGDYQVNIQHAMRKNGEAKGVEYLEGITDIGFRVEQTQNN